MSMDRRRDGLFWPSLFFGSTTDGKEWLLKIVSSTNLEYDKWRFTKMMLSCSGLNNASCNRLSEANPGVCEACERVALKFMLYDSNLAADLLDDDALAKAKELYQRKQYNSKPLRELLEKFFIFIIHMDRNRDLSGIKNIFTVSILDAWREIEEKRLNDAFAPLKKAIDRIASGVRGDCYFRAAVDHISLRLEDPLNEYWQKRVGYSFNTANKYRSPTVLYPTEYYDVSNSVLQTALLDDEAFWDSHKDFCISSFINEVYFRNDIRHAEKIIDQIIENLKKNESTKTVFEKGLPLYMCLQDMMWGAIEDAARRSFKRLDKYCDISVLDSVRLCYPMRPADPDAVEIGRRLFEKFICEYNYPNDGKTVMALLEKELDSYVFIPYNRHVSRDTSRIADIISYFPYKNTEEMGAFIPAFSPEYFSKENICTRLYLEVYAVTLLSPDEKSQLTYLQRLYCDLLKRIEIDTGICTAHQLDTSERNRSYEALKAKMHSLGVDISDEFKNDYIISLLDRNTARIDESARFPVLEQAGDAIYGLAAAELLFYDPGTRGMPKRFENLTRAETQVAIAKAHGFDKLYVETGLPAKYVDYGSVFFDYETEEEERLQGLIKEKYLADTLEMIIGTVLLDKGIEVAIDFAKKMIRNVSKDKIGAEIRPTEENINNRDIDRDYWSRILPSPCTVMTENLQKLWQALEKTLLVACLKTEEKDIRKYITYGFSNTAVFGEYSGYGVSWIFYDYLQQGIRFVLDKYGEKILKNYKKETNQDN